MVIFITYLHNTTRAIPVCFFYSFKHNIVLIETRYGYNSIKVWLKISTTLVQYLHTYYG